MKRITEIIAEKMNIPKDVIMDLPRISLCGDREIYVENHKGLMEYTDSVIRIRMNDGIINICGEGLRIILMEFERMVINGVFDGVNYEKIGRNLKNVQKKSLNF